MKILEKFLTLFSYPTSLKIGRLAGNIAYYLFKKRREMAIQNFLSAFEGKYTHTEAQKMIQKSFQHLGMTFVEFLRFSQFTTENLSHYVTFHNKALLDKIYAQKKGILALTLHMGNWELLAASMRLSGFNTAIIVKAARQKITQNYLIKQREQKNLILLMGKNIIKSVLKFLKTGGMIGVILDQSAIRREGILVPFFKRPAYTLKSLAILSQRTEATILPIYTYRDENYHHHIVIDQPITHHPDEDIQTCTLKYTTWMEKVITQHPEQWMWTHNRWKKRR